MSRFSVLKNHPSLLWLILMGATIVAPMLISLILWIFALEIWNAGLSPIGSIIFSVIFSLITLGAIAFWQAVVIQSVHTAQKKKFRLLDGFKDIRPLFGRTSLLLVLSVVWVLLLSAPLLFIHSLALEIVLGIMLLITPFVFLKTSVLLRNNSVFESLSLSARQTFTKKRLVEWSLVKTCSLLFMAVLLLGSYSLLAELGSVSHIVRIILSFLGFSWFSALSPVFGFLLLLGGNGVGHVALLFALSLVLHFSYVLVLTDN